MTLVVGFAQAPAPQPPPQPPPTFRTEANYVRVDAYPTKDDAPVTDLTQADFEILEAGAPQKIEQFERVVIRAAGPQDTRLEPNTVRESLAMAQSSRARLIVIFLDTYHVEIDGSRNIRKPLVDALDKLIGADDLVAVMTPEMSAHDITFARKTTTIDGFLTRYWHWGERARLIPADPVDEEYGACYPNRSAAIGCADQNGIAAEMIDRRHEKLTLDALDDLVDYLRGVREERKAILAVSDGWLLFRPNENLMRPLACQGVPTGPTVSVDPRSGKLTTKDPAGAVPNNKCDADRMRLAQLDNDRQFRDLLDAANRANASFYPVDPRGLAVFDTPVMRQDVPGPPPPIIPASVDQAMLRDRISSLRSLAEATDGLAIVNSNDLAKGLKRVVDDLSSYYLIGYYSTGKLDGKFHSISVRVKRPGVRVRARRGYLASTPASAATLARSAAGKRAPTIEPAEAAAAHAVEAAIAPLSGYTRDVPLRLQLAAGWKPNDSASAAMWVVGELGAVATMGDAWAEGFDATVTLTTPADAPVGSGRISVPRGGRTFRVAVTASQPLVPGEYVLRVGARAGAASIPSRETARVTIPAAPEAIGALFVRRGASTGNKDVPTADLRFRRNETVRVEIPALSGDPVTARLLDRTGKPLAVPVTAAVRDDADGSRWVTAQLALSPLAPADYAIEITAGSGGERRMISAFRVVP
ncbi:MAG TPA: VWA domain-containing protein [Vicinamibacterales bacterium]|nr:VWA domain-containing protein [Vicinamibacterales bacterium]